MGLIVLAMSHIIARRQRHDGKRLGPLGFWLVNTVSVNSTQSSPIHTSLTGGPGSGTCVYQVSRTVTDSPPSGS